MKVEKSDLGQVEGALGREMRMVRDAGAFSCDWVQLQ